VSNVATHTTRRLLEDARLALPGGRAGALWLEEGWLYAVAAGGAVELWLRSREGEATRVHRVEGDAVSGLAVVEGGGVGLLRWEGERSAALRLAF
jgi:hypothetical protein